MCNPLLIAGTALAGYAGYTGVKYVGKALSGGSPPPPPEELPAENTDASATQNAQFSRRRTLRALSGSNTDLTKGLASPLTGSPKTLLGS